MTLVDGMTVSNPSSASILTTGDLLASASTAPTVSYISLAPNSVQARLLLVRNKTQRLTPVAIPVVDGGFDPVPVIANPDDALELTFTLMNGGAFRSVIKAPARRGPGVVRTNPPKGTVPHAKVWFETAMDLVAATTTSDKDGRYAICNLPAFWSVQDFTVTADGYEKWYKGVSVSGAGIIELDIELKR